MNLESLSHRWLVVDDDPAIRSLTVRVLHSLPGGGEVIACADGCAAVKALAAAPEAYDLLVTDFDMPGLDGFELAALVRQLRPRLPILLISGHPFTRSEIVQAGIDAWLPKPFLIEDLMAALQRLLDTRDEASSGRVRSTLSTLAH
jgi:CheY-like chemotaxis protein